LPFFPAAGAALPDAIQQVFRMFKLASILHRMWVSETDFHVGFGAKVTQRLRLKPVQ
jgi:hypothetical protein